MRRLWVLPLLFVCAGTLSAEIPSAKTTVALFGISDLPLPAPELQTVDLRIAEVFASSNRVLRLPYRLTAGDLSPFIQAMSRVKSAEATIAGAVEIGGEAIPAAELRRIAASSLAVIPDVTSYLRGFSEAGGYNARLETSFTIVDLSTLATLAHIAVEALGTGVSPQRALREAADQIPIQLALEGGPGIESIPGPVSIEGSTALIRFGRKMGVHVGEKFAVLSTRLSPSGGAVSRQTGLLLVSSVREDYSYARVLYAEPIFGVGDRLREIPQIGFESTAYFHVIANANAAAGAIAPPLVYSVGTYESVTRGFYNFRPLIGIESAIASAFYAAGGVPLSLYLGAELNWRFGRFALRPVFAGGVGGMIPLQSGASFTLTMAGGFGQLSLSYLIGNNLRLSIDGGYVQWLPLVPNGGFGGYYGGIGIGMDL